jgi:predicted nucleic acid-binding protein
MLTLDANIWIAAYDPKDAFHAQSTTFLFTVTSRQLTLHGPTFMLIETACALARRTQSPVAGQAAVVRLQAHPLLTLHALDETLLAAAIQFGVQRLLRGADAIYAATAANKGTPLVSWNEELVRRAGAITPADWLAANP